MIEYSGLKISWLGHNCFRIEGDVAVYTDPFKIKGGKPADLILISHSHSDHLSPDDVRKVVSGDSIAVAPRDCEAGLEKLGLKDVKTVAEGESLEVLGVSVKAVPAYNVNKFRSPGVPFHPRQSEGVGYVFKMGGVTIYHTGDTDFIPEMEGLNIDVMLIPVSGTFVMTAEEAAQATERIEPRLAIPMHYGTIVGSRSDAEKFSGLAECKVEILDREG